MSAKELWAIVRVIEAEAPRMRGGFIIAEQLADIYLSWERKCYHEWRHEVLCLIDMVKF